MTAELSERNKGRFIVAKSLRAIAMQWDRRGHIAFTGHEVAAALRNAADAMDELIKKDTTIIKP